MVNIERTQRDFIRKQINEVVEPARIGKVISVFEHTDEDDNSNFEVTVNFIGEDTQHVQVPYQCVTADGISVPRVGDKVVIEYRRGSDAAPVARNFVYTNEDRAPLGKAGMWRKRLPSPETETGDGDLYVTAYTEYDEDVSSVDKDDANPEKATFQIVKSQPSETVVENPEAGITITDSEEDSYITLEAHNIGDNNITIEQTFNLDDGTVEVSTSSDDLTQDAGMKIDGSTGEVKMLDSEGSGLLANGEGEIHLIGEDTSGTL